MLLDLTDYDPNTHPYQIRDEDLHAPEIVEVLDDGRAVAKSAESRDVTYPSLQALLDDFQIDRDHLLAFLAADAA